MVSAAAIAAAAELAKLEGTTERLTFSPLPDDVPMSDISPVASTVISGPAASSPDRHHSPTPEPEKDYTTTVGAKVAGAEKAKHRSVNE